MAETMTQRLTRLTDERDAAIGENMEYRKRLSTVEEDVELLSARLEAEKNRYGTAIQVLHHGLRQTVTDAVGGDGFDSDGIRQLVGVPAPALQALVTIAIGIGYAYALEVMTRRPAPDHLRSAFEWVLRRSAESDEQYEAMMVLADTMPIKVMYESAMRAFPKPPHDAYEEDHGGNGS
jgi:hypothetical protein